MIEITEEESVIGLDSIQLKHIKKNIRLGNGTLYEQLRKSYLTKLYYLMNRYSILLYF